MCGHTPLAVLESLVVLRVLDAEPWCAPGADVQTLCLELGLNRDGQTLVGKWWEGLGLVLFVDGAHDGPFWRMGGFSKHIGFKLAIGVHLRSLSQQLVELQSLAWGVCLAIRLGYASATLVSDSEVAIAQLLRVRAKSVLSAQQKVLWGLVRRPVCPGIVVRVLWVPTRFQPADPLSCLQGVYRGDKMKAERMAWLIDKQLLQNPSLVQFREFLCLGKGTES